MSYHTTGGPMDEFSSLQHANAVTVQQSTNLAVSNGLDMHHVGHIHRSFLFEILTVPFPLGQEHR
jgi:hypothetical protein